MTEERKAVEKMVTKREEEKSESSLMLAEVKIKMSVIGRGKKSCRRITLREKRKRRINEKTRQEYVSFSFSSLVLPSLSCTFPSVTLLFVFFEARGVKEKGRMTAEILLTHSFLIFSHLTHTNTNFLPHPSQTSILLKPLLQ